MIYLDLKVAVVLSVWSETRSQPTLYDTPPLYNLATNYHMLLPTKTTWPHGPVRGEHSLLKEQPLDFYGGEDDYPNSKHFPCFLYSELFFFLGAAETNIFHYINLWKSIKRTKILFLF